MKKNIRLLTALTGCLLFFANFLALKFYWYVAIPWFDHLTHFLGGLFLAFLFSMVLRRVSWSPRRYFFLSILFVAAIGGLWELYELSVQELVGSIPFVTLSDSMSDLFFDVLGGVVGWLVVRRQ